MAEIVDHSILPISCVTALLGSSQQPSGNSVNRLVGPYYNLYRSRDITVATVISQKGACIASATLDSSSGLPIAASSV